MPDPWMMLAEMVAVDDSSPLNIVRCKMFLRFNDSFCRTLIITLVSRSGSVRGSSNTRLVKCSYLTCDKKSDKLANCFQLKMGSTTARA